MSDPLPNTSELSLPTDGADTDTWGLLDNSLHAAWDRFLGGAVNHDMSGADWPMTANEGQTGRFWLTGNSPVARSIVLPENRYRTWVVYNGVQGAGTYMQIIQAGAVAPISIPANTIAVIMSLPGALFFASPPIEPTTGGFLASLIQPGYAYFGPSLFFSNRQVGFGSPDVGYLAMFLAASNANAELRFQAANSPAQPMIACLRPGPIWDTGLYFPGGGEVRVAALGTDVARFTNAGIAVGASNGPTGAGTVNANQFFRSGRAMPFQFPVYIFGLGLGAFAAVAHGIGGVPTGIFGRLECIVGDIGYNVGDQVDAANTRGIAYGADAASGFCSATGTVTLPRKGTGIDEAITKSRWRLNLILAWP
jgi:hypothetical protein